MQCLIAMRQVLKSGVILCQLILKIKPGSCREPSKMNAPFKQRENIGNYLSACASVSLAD